MSVQITGQGYEMEHIVKNGPWSSFRDGGTMVDAGGSQGDAMVAVAKSFPSLHFVIQDLGPTIEAHPALPGDLAGGITFMAHDFFTKQPVENVDVFLFRWIYHD